MTRTYTYQFKLESQSLVSNTTPGSLTISTGSGQLPLIPSGSNWSLLPSSNGLVNYYDLSYATVFALNDCKNYLNFSVMYDQYKIKRVGLELEYLNTSSLASASGLMPTAYFYWDRDDVAIPANLASITRRQGVKRRQFGNKSQISLRTRGKPNLLMGVQDSITATLSGVVPLTAKYIDCTQEDVPHYALKGFISDIYLPGAASTQAFRFNWTYDISFVRPLVCA